MLVRDWMTDSPTTVRPTTSILEARWTLGIHGVRHLPVVDHGGEVVGMISDRDVRIEDQDLPERLAETGSDLVMGRDRPVGRVMSSPVFVTSPKDTVEAASRRMVDRRIGALPVVDGRQLVGILSLTDCVRALLGTNDSGKVTA